MSNRPLKRALVGLVSLTLAAPLPVMAQAVPAVDADKASDGVVSPAACRAFGFTVADRSGVVDYLATVPAMSNSIVPPAPMPPPPPPPPRRRRPARNRR